VDSDFRLVSGVSGGCALAALDAVVLSATDTRRCFKAGDFDASVALDARIA
jgi:hypothetical protein